MKPRNSLFLMNVIVEDDDDRTPDILVRAMRAEWGRVRLLDTDGWTDRNAHDPGVTVVQLFLWLSTALVVVIGVVVLRRLIARPFPSGCSARLFATGSRA